MKKFCSEHESFYEDKSGRWLGDNGKLLTKSQCHPHRKNCACLISDYCPDCMNEEIACVCMYQNLSGYWK